jgi:hypothetical protein
MSYHGNGQRRYGYVPPAQYGLPGGQDPNNPNNGLQRQSSFRTGDDGALPDPNNNGYQNTASSGMATMYLTSPTPTSAGPPGRGAFGNPNPAMSGYQHQYQPFAGGSQSPAVGQPSYNPQQFARTQSQLQAQAPLYQPHLQSHPQSQPQPGPSLNNSALFGVQPYNPANYTTSQGPPLPGRQPTVSGYNSYSNSSYGSVSTPLVSQTPTYWPAGQQYGNPVVPARPSAYEPPLASQTYPLSNSGPPLPPRQPLYNPAQSSAPYPTNGDTYSQGDYTTPVATQAPYTNFTGYTPQSVSQSHPAALNPSPQRLPAHLLVPTPPTGLD